MSALRSGSRAGAGLRAVDRERLIAAAREARSHAHAPYSGFHVGAAVLTRAGRIYAGCNVENASYGATVCAERGAVSAMVAAGDRDPIACAVVAPGPEPAMPCGVCRQVLAEFATDMRVVLAAEDGAGHIVARYSTRLEALLPHAFRLGPPPGGARPKRVSRGGSPRPRDR